MVRSIRCVKAGCVPDAGSTVVRPCAEAARSLLSRKPWPTALLFDNDVMALAGSAVAHEMGLRVPGDLSIIAGDDSPLCQHVHPPLTAVYRDIGDLGQRAARSLLQLLDGTITEELHAPSPWLVPRGSTGPPPG